MCLKVNKYNKSLYEKQDTVKNEQLLKDDKISLQRFRNLHLIIVKDLIRKKAERRHVLKNRD